MVLYILGILNIWKSFSSYEEGDSTTLINRMLIHKYGLVAFSYTTLFCCSPYIFRRCGTDIHDRRSDYTTYAPSHECYDIFTVIGFWLTILPGSFYALQVIRMTYKAGKSALELQFYMVSCSSSSWQMS